MAKRRKARRRWLGLLCLLALGGWFWSSRPKALATHADSRADISPWGALQASPTEATQASIRDARPDRSPQDRPLGDWLSPLRHFPAPDTLVYQDRAYRVVYGIDSALQESALRFMRRFRPETGTLLVSDLETGHLLAAVESDTASIGPGLRWALRATYPAASLIKIVTASAGLGNALRGPDDSLWQLGSNHTLYRSQLRTERCGNCPKVELREAFARSINPAFAVLGLKLGPQCLQTEAEKYGFNASPLSSLWQPSRFSAPDSGFPLAETACGFTSRSTLSPLHALQIARALGDDGRLLVPVLAPRLEALHQDGSLTAPYAYGPPQRVAEGATLAGLQDLMAATTRSGTARKGFHRAMRAQELDRIESGGKTGSLDGDDPPGRYEWFIGYVRLKENPSKGLAVAVMLIHKNYLAVHPSELAAYVVRDWVRRQVKAARKGGTDAV